jgi:hypothetical protein
MPFSSANPDFYRCFIQFKQYFPSQEHCGPYSQGFCPAGRSRNRVPGAGIRGIVSFPDYYMRFPAAFQYSENKKRTNDHFFAATPLRCCVYTGERTLKETKKKRTAQGGKQNEYQHERA